MMDALSGASECEKYHLEKGKTYDYLPSSPAHAALANMEKFSAVKHAFDFLEFSESENDTILKILAAILLCGQVHFKQMDDKVDIQNMEVMEKS